MEKQMIDPADVQKVIDRHSWADENTDCKNVLDNVLRDLHELLPRDYPEDMLGMWAEHPEYGRVLVIRAKPDGEGEVAIAYRDGCARTGVWHTWVDPSTLSFPEQHPETLATPEDYENAPEGTIVAVGQVSMSRDDVLRAVSEARVKGERPNLRDANLRFANLFGADLRGADLRGADLFGANLRGALWGGLQITDLPSGQLTLIPTPDGWQLHVGCWHGTPDKLRDMIAQDEGWPEAEGDEITRRRPYLQAALALCEVHMADHADVINELKEKWGE